MLDDNGGMTCAEDIVWLRGKTGRGIIDARVIEGVSRGEVSPSKDRRWVRRAVQIGQHLRILCDIYLLSSESEFSQLADIEDVVMDACGS